MWQEGGAGISTAELAAMSPFAAAMAGLGEEHRKATTPDIQDGEVDFTALM